jgi:hypothetical protein
MAGRWVLSPATWVRFPYGSLQIDFHGQVVKLGDTRRSNRRAAKRESSNLSLATEFVGESFHNSILSHGVTELRNIADGPVSCEVS